MLPASCRQCFPPIGLPARCQQHSGVHGSLHDFDAVHWDHEPVWVVPSLRCPAFGRPGPAKAGLQTGGSWNARSALRPCIGTMNPPLTPPSRGPENSSDERSPLGRGRGWDGSWKASFGPASASGSRRSIGVGSNCSPVFSWPFFCSAVRGPVCPEAEFRGTAWSLWPSSAGSTQ